MKLFPRSILLFATAGIAAALALAQTAIALDIVGVKLDDSVKLDNTNLKLNGAGVRTKVFFKVYAAGLYLSDKKSTLQDVLDAQGPRRIELVMLRDVSSSDFSEAFTQGLNANSDNNEKARLAAQIVKFENLFASTPTVKKGDVITVDWMPAIGTVVQLNGKSLSEPLPELAFYNAMLKIWLGDQPVDEHLKPLLLGVKN